MKIGIACGGTGGHLAPGIVTGEALMARGHDVDLWITGRRVENDMLTDWSGGVERVESKGLAFGPSLWAIGTLFGYLRAIRECRRRMRSSPPAVLLAMGGYPSVGPCVAAHRHNRPVVLHESNVIPGRAVHYLCRYAAAVAVALPAARENLRHDRIVVTGMPLRREIVECAARRESDAERLAAVSAHGLEPGRYTLMITGGSQGAEALNSVGVEAARMASARGAAIQVLHVCGARHETAIRASYQDAGFPVCVYGFLADIASAYLASDMILCRAGASTCAEVTTCRLHALLVPYPHAQAAHQLANAQALSRPGVIDVMDESGLSPAGLAEILVRRAQEGRRNHLPPMPSPDHTHAADSLADLVIECAAR